jgi:hypothetical protein
MFVFVATHVYAEHSATIVIRFEVEYFDSMMDALAAMIGGVTRAITTAASSHGLTIQDIATELLNSDATFSAI